MVRPRKQQKPQRASGSGFVENALQKLEEEQENRKTMVKKPKQQPKKGKKKVVQNIDGKGKEEDERLAPTLKGLSYDFKFLANQYLPGAIF
ncbi:hypothetical protein COLO4_13524 [Corchorus olitorius]|uniref:Uncharacterized protein n=1 Tax=Corchorus olitorius TaxID=93759 RepID=A0A1R3JW41_9ROSI|nr:hypothetical protein COLO4_13524 [Corchorus olitorius]